LIPTLAITAILLYVLWDRRVERREWEADRRLLLTRIQAPQMAPALASEEPITPREHHVPIDDDEAWKDYREELSANGGS
jgi:hypothetical protein